MEINVKEHLQLLGHRVSDKVTKFKGVVISISFDLYGCIVADVRPEELGENGKVQQGYWLDVNRLVKKSKKPLMKQPSFCFEEVSKQKVEGASDKTSKYTR